MTVAVGVTAGAAFDLEDGVGLRALFFLRGPSSPPNGVLVVSIDETSTAALGLERQPRDWPRSLHARLIERLTERGTSVIAFDVDFSRHTETAEDDALARAIVGAGNVVLLERITQRAGPEGLRPYERQMPVPAFLRGARAVAPAVVPDEPMVRRIWTFFPFGGQGTVPTLPAVTLQVHSLGLLDRFRTLLAEAGIAVSADALQDDDSQPWLELRRWMLQARNRLDANGPAVRGVVRLLDEGPEGASTSRENDSLMTLVRMYADPDAFYINYYGPAGAIATIPYHRALEELAEARLDVAGTIVFVGGGFSTLASADQLDTHPTVFGDMSGVEIQATALANLLNGEALRRMGGLAALALLLVFAALAVGIAALLPRRQSATVALLMALAYSVLSYTIFSRSHVIAPLAVPLLVQLPLAFLLVRLSRPASIRRVVRGACLVTDVTGSTTVSKAVPPERLHGLLDAYRREIRTVVERWSGLVETPQVGDSLVCLWVGTGCRRRACLASLEITDAVRRFNASQVDEGLPTRIGLHFGELSVEQNIDGDRRTVEGETVIVAKRLEELAKTLLGRQPDLPPILASASVREAGDDLLVRDLGPHAVRDFGVQRVLQIVGAGEHTDERRRELCKRFAAALALYESGHLTAAERDFRLILTTYPDDAPSLVLAEASAAKAKEPRTTVAEAEEIEGNQTSTTGHEGADS